MLLQGILPKQPGENALMLRLLCGHSRDLSTTRRSPARCLRFRGAALEMTDARFAAGSGCRCAVKGSFRTDRTGHYVKYLGHVMETQYAKRLWALSRDAHL